LNFSERNLREENDTLKINLANINDTVQEKNDRVEELELEIEKLRWDVEISKKIY